MLRGHSWLPLSSEAKRAKGDRKSLVNVAQTSKSAVSRISKSAGHPNSTALPTWKSAHSRFGNLRYGLAGCVRALPRSKPLVEIVTAYDDFGRY